MAQLKDLIVTGASRFLGNIYGNLKGNADTATSATKATQDSAGQQINTTYIKGLSVSGKTVTYTKGDGTPGTITTQDTTYSNATTSAAGLMSASDKTKLDGIATGANKTVVDTALSSTSTNPVQNKVVNTAISNLNTLVGTKSVATQISDYAAPKNHTHDYAAASHTHSYLPLSGGTVTGNSTFQKDLYVAGNVHFRTAETVTSGSKSAIRNSICIYGTTYGNDSSYIKTNGKLSYGDPGPQIIFGTDDNLSSSQKAALIFTDHDTIAAGCSLSLVSTETSCAFIAPKVYGAVWNDYAEFRICKEQFTPGQVVSENGDDTLSISTERLQRGCSIISDTFGFAIGETDEAKCPIAVTGRVLAYPFEPIEEFRNHIGYPVCSGPNGTVSIMTEEEEEKYPSRIIGTISAIPDYKTWGSGNVEVKNRIWIKVK